mgnify:CR=1 FL=1
MATMPAEFTKTGVAYKWDIPKSANPAVRLLRDLHKHVPTLEHQLEGLHKFNKALENWFTIRVMKDAAAEENIVSVRSPAGAKYNMRSVRCWYATKYGMDAAEAAREGRQLPPNPLQHTNIATTFGRYMAKGAADLVEAGRRL